MTITFLQSPEWERFQKILGRKTWRAAGNLVIEHKLPYGFTYLYSPRPGEINEGFLSEVADIAAKEKNIFLKIDPDMEASGLQQKLGVPSDPLQPPKTLIVDISKSEDELLSAMHEKTRYNIRLADRKGVLVVNFMRTTFREDFDVFWKMLQNTASRGGFYIHERKHYENLLQIKTRDFSNELFFARYQKKTLAAVMINFYYPSGTATYLHGASSREHKEVMASYLLHWQVLLEAKKRGFKFYDFWGVDEKKWPGLTRFKRGFGGGEVVYPKSIDIVFRPFMYNFYRIVKFFRK